MAGLSQRLTALPPVSCGLMDRMKYGWSDINLHWCEVSLQANPGLHDSTDQMAHICSRTSPGVHWGFHCGHWRWFWFCSEVRCYSISPLWTRPHVHTSPLERSGLESIRGLFNLKAKKIQLNNELVSKDNLVCLSQTKYRIIIFRLWLSVRSQFDEGYFELPQRRK